MISVAFSFLLCCVFQFLRPVTCQLFLSALTDLTVSSYEEDKFGVVQKSLPEIISTLLVLQEVGKQEQFALSVRFQLCAKWVDEVQ